jgi:hypothetical protein
MMKSPWNPPEHAETFSLRRKTPDGWEACSAEHADGQVHTRNPCGITRAMFLALWGGGAYEATFHKADGKGAGRSMFRLNVPSRPAAATKHTAGEVQPDPENDAGDEGEDVEDEPEDESDPGGAAPAAASPAASPDVATMMETMRRELLELRAENRRLRGLATVVPQRKAPEPPPATLGAIPGLTGEAAATLSLFMHLQSIAETKARYEIDRIQAVEDARTARDDARHRRDMEDQAARHAQSLELLRTLADERARPRDQLVTELRNQLKAIEDSPPELVQAGPLEVAAAQALPLAAQSLAEILKFVVMKSTAGAVTAALPAVAAA